MFKGLRYSQGEFANYEPSGNYMYRQFNIQLFYVLPTQTVFMCFVWIWEQRLFPYTALTDWFVQETECVYCAVRTESLYIIQVDLRLLSLSHTSGKPYRTPSLVCRTAGQQSACIRKVLRPAIWTHTFSLLLCPQANAEMFPNIPSCHQVLLVQPSRFKFAKINPPALK